MLEGWRQRPCLVALVFALVILSGASFARSARAQDVRATPLQRCNSIVSLDERLLMEQWAASGQCDRPVQTRVIDQFLGFTCQEFSPERTACRSFVPRPDSRIFDTAKRFRCVDFGVINGDAGVAIARLREWAAPPKQCDWDPYAGVLAIEIDFEHRQVCLAAFCFDIVRLSATGRTRLRRLVTSAFEELSSNAQGAGLRGIAPDAQRGVK
jgi:hypothetical protein